MLPLSKTEADLSRSLLQPEKHGIILKIYDNSTLRWNKIWKEGHRRQKDYQRVQSSTSEFSYIDG